MKVKFEPALSQRETVLRCGLYRSEHTLVYTVWLSRWGELKLTLNGGWIEDLLTSTEDPERVRSLNGESPPEGEWEPVGVISSEVTIDHATGEGLIAGKEKR